MFVNFFNFHKVNTLVSDTKKQIKFFDFSYMHTKASIITLTNWIHLIQTPLLGLTFFPNILTFSFLSLFGNKLVQILQFKILLVLVIYLHSFTRYNVFTFNSKFINLLKSTYFSYNFNFILFTNINVLTWTDLNKQLFNSGFLNLTFRTTRRNIFLIVSTASGAVLWKKSSGIVGFNGKHKKAPEAIRKLSESLVSFLRSCNVTSLFIFRFFFIKSFEKNKLDALVNLLSQAEIFYTYIIYDVRHPHGYMRLRKQRRL